MFQSLQGSTVPVRICSYGFLGLLILASVHSWGGYGTTTVSISFNWHPLFMTLAFVTFMTEGVLTWKASPLKSLSRDGRKSAHLWVQLLAILCAIAGFILVLVYHSENNFANFASVHSWLGLATFAYVLIQAGLGLWVFALDSPDLSAKVDKVKRRGRFQHSHRFLGLFTFALAQVTIFTGLMENQSFATCTGDYCGQKIYGGVLALVLVLMNFFLFVNFGSFGAKKSAGSPSVNSKTNYMSTAGDSKTNPLLKESA